MGVNHFVSSELFLIPDDHVYSLYFIIDVYSAQKVCL